MINVINKIRNFIAISIMGLGYVIGNKEFKLIMGDALKAGLEIKTEEFKRALEDYNN